MKVKFIGGLDTVCLKIGKEYEVIGIEDGNYRVIDEEGYDEDEEIQGYLYLPKFFEIVEGNPSEFVDPFDK